MGEIIKRNKPDGQARTSRRGFFKLLGLAGLGAVATACEPKNLPETDPGGTGRPGSETARRQAAARIADATAIARNEPVERNIQPVQKSVTRTPEIEDSYDIQTEEDIKNIEQSLSRRFREVVDPSVVDIEVIATPGEYVAKDEGVYKRDYPSRESKIVGTLNAGEKVVSEYQVKVIHNDERDEKGWVVLGDPIDITNIDYVSLEALIAQDK